MIQLESGKSYVWQWDTRQRIILEGYPAGIFIHYANYKTQDAPVVATQVDGDHLVADIPPELMQEPYDITVYACDDTGTVHRHFIPVLERPRPENYIYEPVEILRYESLDVRLRKLENGGQGINGITPHIGENGNWWTGEIDTGVAATGPQGPQGEAGSVGPKGPAGATGPQGPAGADGKDGAKGDPGPQGDTGATGRGIKTIARTSGNGAAGTTDTYTITYTDDTTSTFQVRNGANGAQGPQGEKGEDGDPGPAGPQGEVGPQGPQGADGKTPVKGVDYFTVADRAEMVQAVVAALPKYAGEVAAV